MFLMVLAAFTSPLVGSYVFIGFGKFLQKKSYQKTPYNGALLLFRGIDHHHFIALLVN
jgi:hypothetical protein